VTSRDAISDAVADAHRREWAFVLAATVRVTRDLDLAEECAQEAFAEALNAWPAQGIPTRPGGWLTTVAKRRALDALRRRATLQRKLPLLLEPGNGDVWGEPDAEQERTPFDNAPDDRLRLVFTCCHPALSLEAQVALTLRLLCGLTTAEVARAFLVTEPAMSARITRAKKKITQARIPYRVPPAQELPQRVDAVLTVVHLLLTTGHSAPAGEELVRVDLVARALDLARMLRQLLPTDPEVAGLLALVLYTDARRATRRGPNGRLLLLSEQDRSQWDRNEIAEGTLLVREAMRGCPPGRFALQAIIAAMHAEAPSWSDTDWRQIIAAYDALLARWPTPVVALNRAVAVGMAHGPAAGLELLDVLGADPALASYGYLPAARADFLRQLGRFAQARTAYEEALLMTDNAVERDFLADRLAALPNQLPN
jgi:RNA polymerase sigma-70 factor (ECF subfamily)